MDVVIIGAGLGGLAAAISLAQEGIRVQILEKTPKILPVGAGIAIPPNGVRALRHLGVADTLREKGAIDMTAINLRSYDDGRELLRRPGGEEFVKNYGEPWFSIRRADYHNLLLDEAVRRGVKIHLGMEATGVDFAAGIASVTVKSGERFEGHVVIGADGIWSTTLEHLLEVDSTPIPTGDMAYRATFQSEALLSLKNEKLNGLIGKPETNIWMGPKSHAVFYPLKGGSVYNVVLVCPGKLPPDKSTNIGDVAEMRNAFASWDPMLREVLGLVSEVLMWKLCHREELVKWTRANAVVIGNASHPTLPYQQQGAAMAVEDGAVLGLLLGRLNAMGTPEDTSAYIPGILSLFERFRKRRTTVNVRGAIDNQYIFHMEDGPDVDRRDEMLGQTNWETQTPTTFSWNDLQYQSDILSFDFITEAERAFEAWCKTEESYARL
ncbi:FAD/NAD(P)-binding domain-containing protein [Tothia fuscella]|uniref:FAD/NAD(P)-binding domain-containing protein n=1 Tax=Tothia fuscella TaxID=1048955 RepID=A0A9P4U3J6_9PEZI|nr:FAD/NAD(P)-binding domain-containing protein [Tothia fuscella]